jgi:hypothetical protein
MPVCRRIAEHFSLREMLGRTFVGILSIHIKKWNCACLVEGVLRMYLNRDAASLTITETSNRRHPAFGQLRLGHEIRPYTREEEP